MADRRGAAAYVVRMGMSVADGERLADVLLRCPAVLSAYHSPLYDELYGDWFTTEAVVQRPSANRRGHSAAPATEVVWSNRDLGGQGTIFDVAEAVA